MMLGGWQRKLKGKKSRGPSPGKTIERRWQEKKNCTEGVPRKKIILKIAPKIIDWSSPCIHLLLYSLQDEESILLGNLLKWIQLQFMYNLWGIHHILTHYMSKAVTNTSWNSVICRSKLSSCQSISAETTHWASKLSTNVLRIQVLLSF